jgi:hypothetical protein
MPTRREQKTMNPNEITTPSAAERYFDATVLGQLYTLMAEALGPTHKRAPARSAATPRPVSPGAPREGLLDRVDRWFWHREQNAREAYLAQSRDVFELERRIEAMERGDITRYY